MELRLWPMSVVLPGYSSLLCDLHRSSWNTDVGESMLNVHLFNFGYPCDDSWWRIESSVSCHGLCRGQATKSCVCCAPLWNNREEFLGHICSCGFDVFLSVSQLVPTVHNLSVIWRNRCVNYVCSGNFSVPFIFCETAMRYCLNRTAADTNL